jgi:hypothetical protein
MTTTRRVRPVLSALVAVAACSGAAVAVPAAAGVHAGAEFDRITADIRAAIERHDTRAFHGYEGELQRLIARATSD